MGGSGGSGGVDEGPYKQQAAAERNENHQFQRQKSKTLETKMNEKINLSKFSNTQDCVIVCVCVCVCVFASVRSLI